MRSYLIYFSIFIVLNACNSAVENKIDLSGSWQFATDPNDMGIAEKWYNTTLAETIELPGSMAENNKGEIPGLETPWTGSIYDSSFYFNPKLEKYRQEGDVKFPFWLTPNRYYKGAAWYQKEVKIPVDWKDKHVVLHLERPHWQTMVWVNDTLIGEDNSLSTPHEFDVTDYLEMGKNVITVRIDNRLNKVNVGPDSHSVSDHTQGNWNGMVGELSLKAGSKICINHMQLFPDINKKQVKVLMEVSNTSHALVEASLIMQAALLSEDNNVTLPVVDRRIKISKGNQLFELVYSIGDDMKLWDEFHPNLYNMKAILEVPGAGNEEVNEIFGMREIKTEGGDIIVNGRKIQLRGTLEDNTFPLTGYPPTNVDDWVELMKTCKESGFNHIRFHSHCPPEAAFDAADQVGVYLQPEAASWPNHGTELGSGRPIDDWIKAETARIIEAYGNHPSFALWAYCNEPYGNYVPFLDADLKNWKAKDNRRIYTAASIGKSWSVNPESEYIVRSNPRGLPFKQQPNATFDYTERIANETRPYITHEMGQYCVFPDFTEIPKYTGVNKAKNFEMFQSLLEENHMGDQAHDFLMASGKLQALCYKAEIEAQLRTSTLDGFQLLGLNDFPGQGSAIIGLLNVFWEEKGYITKEEISHFCNQTVPLAKLDKFVFTNNEVLKADLLVSHYGPINLDNCEPFYEIMTADSNLLLQGKIASTNIVTGKLTSLGHIDLDLSMIDVPTQCKLMLKVNEYTNNWYFWVFPKTPVIENDQVYYTHELNDQALRILEEGGKVLLDASGSVENGKDVIANFTPVFWNTSWFKMRPPHTLGFLVQDKHPAFADFPTSYHSDYQWWEIVNGQQVMQIDSFPPTFRPMVQPIDTWFLNRRLAQLFEASIGKGKLMVTSLNINPANGPASAQLRASLVKYMNSQEFQPEQELDIAVVQELFEVKTREQVKLYTKEDPDELQPNYKKKHK